MGNEEKELWVNMRFRGPQVDEFLAVKAYLGIQNNTDVLRHLLRQHANEIDRQVYLAGRYDNLVEWEAEMLRRKMHWPTDEQRQAVEDALRQVVAAETAPGDHGASERGAGAAPVDDALRRLCLNCPLPECDETDPRCLYRRAGKN